MNRAICLLSGGLDSATTLAIAKSEGWAVHALTFDYGQRATAEVQAALKVAAHIGVASHKVFQIDLRQIGGSALTEEWEVPKQEPVPGTIPSTYVPARNTILLSCALGYAEVIRAAAIYIGVNSLDYSGYPDCRPEFITAFERLAGLATRMGSEGVQIRIHAPLISLSKADIIRRGAQLGVDYGWTFSCYDPSPTGLACGLCESCRIRLNGFKEAGLVDPIPYQSYGK
ncbi:MAG TPA: 7-cyano-7-deazaguanine synthase QueC [bacterium]|nr:7-cyano-7-deazaguanine synthase QueC [bacterium]HPN32948.1 7-cyano-7-deazaguanine synthase QueC [bacterium]